MENPFTWIKNPQTAREYQENANHLTYERQGAQDILNDFGTYDQICRRPLPAAKQEAYAKAVADVHTLEWVEKEARRQAQSARLKGKQKC